MLKGKALLTGASGFIGGRLREALLDRGIDVISLLRPSSPKPSRGRSMVADYADVDGLSKRLAEERPDYVFHVAGATKGRSYADFCRANVMPTSNLLEAVRRSQLNLQRFLLVSSLASYGPSSRERPLSETDERKPIEFYGQSKLEAEQKIESISDVPWTIVRPAGVYGPGDADYFNLFKTAAQGYNVFFGNHDRQFSAVYIDDCVRGILAAAASPNAIGKGYFLCDGSPITWATFQSLIVDALGRKVRTVHLPEFFVHVAAVGGELATLVDGKPRLFNRQKAKMGAQEAWTCTHASAHRDFEYAPELTVEAGVPMTARWYRENGWC